MYERIEDKLNKGGVVILDGGTGTDIERRGVKMDDDLWCAMANLTHGDVVREVHDGYIAAGAEIITANTYASSPLQLKSHGREDELRNIDLTALKIARDAADAAGRPVVVAGSFSVMPPVDQGTDKVKSMEDWQRSDLDTLIKQKAEVLVEGGSDMIIMEMMRDDRVSLWATEAAVATGLPVWVGISPQRRDDGKLAGFANHHVLLDDAVATLMGTGARACLMMHHEISLTEDCFGIIRQHFEGPMGAYPESGHFEMPTWRFGDIKPAAFAAECRKWQGQGAQIFGGCCGMTPDHISALSAEFAEGVAA